MNNMYKLSVALSLLLLVFKCCECYNRPNIVVILADDVVCDINIVTQGRNDFSLHGSSQIPTPNIDALGYNGVILSKHYSMHICTPSRAALLTGNYPIRAGLQGRPLAAGEPRSLPLSMPTIAEKLSKLGYTTHLVGKWHLGHQNRSVTPLERGFDTHLGYWSGFVGYFTYRLFEENRWDGFDLHNGHHPARNYSGIYATDLFTYEAINRIISRDKDKPFFLLVNHMAGHTGTNGTALEVPNVTDAMKKFSYIQNPERRIYAEMIVRLDESVGKIVKALGDENILKNTVVVFMSDNGAKTVGYYQNHGSNWPFRGLKSTLYEGGVRNSAVIWSKELKQKHHVDNRLFHIVDWMPTLYSAAGGNVSDLSEIDGINHWPYLSQEIEQYRQSDVLLNIDEKSGHEAIISSCGRYKILKGTDENYTSDAYYGDSGRLKSDPSYDVTAVLESEVNSAILLADDSSPPLTKQIIMDLRNKLEIKQLETERKNITCIDYCLFDLNNDPTETTDISSYNIDIVDKLSESLEKFRKQLVPQRNQPVDNNSNPIYCFDNYFTWLDSVYKCTI